MRRDVQEIFRNTPHSKQVMMFSATLSKEIRPVCKKFMQDVSETPIYSTKPYCNSSIREKSQSTNMCRECFLWVGLDQGESTMKSFSQTIAIVGWNGNGELKMLMEESMKFEQPEVSKSK